MSETFKDRCKSSAVLIAGTLLLAGCTNEQGDVSATTLNTTLPDKSSPAESNHNGFFTAADGVTYGFKPDCAQIVYGQNHVNDQGARIHDIAYVYREDNGEVTVDNRISAIEPNEQVTALGTIENRPPETGESSNSPNQIVTLYPENEDNRINGDTMVIIQTEDGMYGFVTDANIRMTETTPLAEKEGDWTQEEIDDLYASYYTPAKPNCDLVILDK